MITVEWFESTGELLQDSISLQMRADVPLGSICRGYHSSLISFSSRHLNAPMKMFHGRFAEGPEYDESKYARALVDYAGGIYNETIPTASEFVTLIPELIYALDEPLAGPGVFPQFCTSRLASKHVKVILGKGMGYRHDTWMDIWASLKNAIMGTQRRQSSSYFRKYSSQLIHFKRIYTFIQFLGRKGIFSKTGQHY